MNEKHQQLLRRIAVSQGIDTEIYLILSSECSVPFAFGFINPMIVLPKDSGKWNIEKIRPILIHEVSHIRRRDYSTQFFARVLCSVYWFLPFIWIAFSRLQIEQEKACDNMVIHDGVQPVDYANQMVMFVKSSRRRYHFAGLSITKDKRTVFEKRIFHILDSTSPKFLSKKIIYLISVLFISLIIIAAACATQMSSYPLGAREIPLEECKSKFYGTWINEEYEGSDYSEAPAFIIKPPSDANPGYGRFECIISAYGGIYRTGGVWEALDSWTDRKGNVYMQIRPYFYDGQKGYSLWKISKKGQQLEYLLHVNGNKPPGRMDPEKYPHLKLLYGSYLSFSRHQAIYEKK